MQKSVHWAPVIAQSAVEPEWVELTPADPTGAIRPSVSDAPQRTQASSFSAPIHPGSLIPSPALNSLVKQAGEHPLGTLPVVSATDESPRAPPRPLRSPVTESAHSLLPLSNVEQLSYGEETLLEKDLSFLEESVPAAMELCDRVTEVPVDGVSIHLMDSMAAAQATAATAARDTEESKEYWKVKGSSTSALDVREVMLFCVKLEKME